MPLFVFPPWWSSLVSPSWSGPVYTTSSFIICSSTRLCLCPSPLFPAFIARRLAFKLNHYMVSAASSSLSAAVSCSKTITNSRVRASYMICEVCYVQKAFRLRKNNTGNSCNKVVLIKYMLWNGGFLSIRSPQSVYASAPLIYSEASFLILPTFHVSIHHF